ncbi:multiple monosaccharide ABC transporter permease [Marasmitruncus massiliensis]|uniref:multiple monosaccharide ABC transporter permease n=1 Tax=Marasmitruncus massiliensis TaxID=1944642 RepID=UPI000C7DAC9B|nr:multiple monosaccharide ABC transporter permease [Marasmitruncus massiliensis]
MTTMKEAVKKNTMLIALAVVMVLFQILIGLAGKGSLFAPSNVSNLINQNAYVVILATGMLLCILTGGNIDLSVGSIVAMIGALAGTLIVNLKLNIYLSILLCLITGILIGMWQGFWIAYVRIPAFIVTLAGMLLWRGVALLILNGLTISPFPEGYLIYFTSFLPNNGSPAFAMTATMLTAVAVCAVFVSMQVLERGKKKRKSYEVEAGGMFAARLVLICAVVLASAYLLGQHKGIPVVLVLLAVIVIAYGYFTSRTVPGRHFYAVGGNEKAAKLSGIDTNRVLFLAYTNMAFLSAVAALTCVARFNSAAPTAGTNYELDAIGACFIGGASAYGGTGTVGGAVIGAIFMGVLNNGMSILGIDANWQKAVKGLVLLAAVIFDVVSKKRSRAS